MNLPSVSVGFPVYNEEATVGDVLREAHELLSRSGLDYEILVCNDGSTDRSREIIEKATVEYPHFKVIDHAQNLGIHAAFERLYTEATKEFVFVNAADRQWKTAILFDLLPLTGNWDIIIASRKKKPYGLFRRFISWCFNALPFILFGVRTFDAGAIKLIRREVVKRFNLVSRSPFSEAERLIRASRAGYRITEYPVSVSPRKAGSSQGVRFRALLYAFFDIFRVWRSL